MSKDVDRNQVVETTSVWTPPKNDDSCSQSLPDQENSEQDNVRAQDQPISQNNVMEESVGTADMSDNGATQVNAELLPEAPVDSTVQDAETLLPSLCEAATLESSPEVASESGADGFPSDQTAVEPSNNATAVTEASSSVASFEHTATPQSETSTTENEADETLPPEKIDENPVEIVANDMPLPDNLTVTYSLPPDASGKNTENVDLVVTTPAVSDASAGVSAINDDTFRGDPPAAEAALKLVADPQLTTENRKVYPPFVYIRTRQELCYFCHKVFDGNVKLIFSDPPLKCHPGCLKCGVCSKDLGDLLTPMFSHEQRITCDSCFSATLKPKWDKYTTRYDYNQCD